MDVITETLVSEESCAAVLAWGCICFLPIRTWWRSLSKETKAKIPLILSTIIGTSDTGLDWVVLIGWYEEGLWKIATAMILIIIISGSFFAWFMLEINETRLSNDGFIQKFLCVLSCFGLGNIILGFLLVRQSPINTKDFYVNNSLKNSFCKMFV